MFADIFQVFAAAYAAAAGVVLVAAYVRGGR